MVAYTLHALSLLLLYMEVRTLCCCITSPLLHACKECCELCIGTAPAYVLRQTTMMHVEQHVPCVLACAASCAIRLTEVLLTVSMTDYATSASVDEQHGMYCDAGDQGFYAAC